MKKIRRRFQMLGSVISYVYHGSPSAFIRIKVVAIIYSFIWFARIPSNQYMIDTVTQALQGKADTSQIIQSIFLVLVILVVGHILNGVNAYNNAYQYNYVLDHLNYQVNAKIDEMMAIEFEDTKKLEMIEKARNGAESTTLLENCIHGLIFFYIPYLLFHGIYFYQKNPALIWVIAMLFFPQVISSFVQTKYNINLENEISPFRRKLKKYEECLIGKENLKDTRNLGANNFFQDKYKEIQKQLHKKQLQVEIRISRLQIFLTMVTLVGYIGVIVLLLESLMQGKISVGTFSATFMMLSPLVGVSKEMAFGTFQNMSKSMGNTANFVTFMERKQITKVGTQPVDYSHGIQINNVSFQYPNAASQSLNGIDLMIQPGETVAVVGENGAGKSTLAKLLLGIYQPTQGTIHVGNQSNPIGHDLISHQNASAVFQNYAKLAMTVKENVAIADVKKKDQVMDYIKQVDLTLGLDQFPQGEDTMLGKEFGGAELSGGQWQRLAIARGLYRSHDFIVFDEPTAAIDPLEEAKIFELLLHMAQNKIAFIITHRLGCVKFVNRIIVLDQGKIVESGTHEQLMKLHGKYYSMFSEQAKWYQR